MIELRKAIALELAHQASGLSREAIRVAWLDRVARDRVNSRIDGARRNVIDRAPNADPVAAAMCAGWNDVFAGNPRPGVYETADKVDQINYELGRALAAATRAVQPLHPWPPSMTYPELKDRGLVTPQAHMLMVAESEYFTKNVRE